MATKRQIKIVEHFIKKETKRLMKEENQNSIDNRLYIAIKDLGSLCSYLSDPKKPITHEEVNKFRNELRDRYKRVDDYIGRYANK